MRPYLVLCILMFSVHGWCESEAESYLKNFLNDFRENPRAAMEQIPPKYDTRGARIQPKRKIPVDVKDRSRQRYCHGAAPGESCRPPAQPLAGISGDDDLNNFFYNDLVETSLTKSGEILTQKLTPQPWSGDYWPTYRGGITARFTDDEFPRSLDFLDYFKFHKANWPVNFYDANKINRLSPAEKYDLLMGLTSRPLTLTILADAHETYQANSKKIEAWFGICHGWAPASFMLARPKKTIEVESVIPNLKIRFYPDDIKALASHLWANATLQSRMMGGRCNDKDPKKDENGRITSDNCYDINPGAWHLAVYNQLGKKGRSFVLDATYDYQVWNQPIVAYKMSFFNPETHATSTNANASMIKMADYKQDRFKRYRSSRAAAVVGVSMQLTYVAEVSATGNTVSAESGDNLVTVQYIYDLEIDQAGDIIGGEWYQNAHPDFIWAPGDHARAISIVDGTLTGKWQAATPPPAAWSEAAAFAARYGQPLAAVVENLIHLAQ